MMFFIRDCNDQIVGNPKGYRTMRGAESQRDMHGTVANRAIWAAFWAKDEKLPNGSILHVSSIKLES